MIRFLFMLLSLTTTDAERQWGLYTYRNATIEQRVYIGRPFPVRFFLDKSDGLWAFHEEGWELNLGYEQEIYFGKRHGHWHFFAVDNHDYSEDYDHPILEGPPEP